MKREEVRKRDRESKNQKRERGGRENPFKKNSIFCNCRNA